MKKIKLTLVAVLVCFLIFALLLDGQTLWAKSKNFTFEMTSDVLCGIGGKSQSATFALKVSAGAQPSPIGKQTSTNFAAFSGWVYTSQPSFVRGDANADGFINSADVVYLLNYLFANGPPPCPEEAGDANRDGVINSADVVYLINYLFAGGPPPSSAGREGLPSLSPTNLNRPLWRSQIGFSTPNLQKGDLARLDDCFEIPIWGKFQQDLAAIELEIEYDPRKLTLLEPELTSLTQGLSIFFGKDEGLQKIGIIDLTGKKTVPAGEGELVILRAKGIDPASIQIKKAILVNREAEMLSVEISPSMQAKMEERATEIPDNFSLSQNYPNPFNPETEIQYSVGSRQTKAVHSQQSSVDSPIHTTLKIYNVLGELVRTLVDEPKEPRIYKAIWDGRDDKGEEVASGIYFYKLQAGDFSQSRKMILLK